MSDDRMHFTESRPCPESQRQFGLGGLLSFFVGCSAYLAMVCSLAELLKMGHPDHRVWPLMAAVPVAWVVLAILYRRWNLPELWNIHRLGILIAGGVALLIVAVVATSLAVAVARAYLGGGALMTGEAIGALGFSLLALWFGAAIGAAISFPAAVLVFLRLGFRGPWPPRECGANFRSPSGTGRASTGTN